MPDSTFSTGIAKVGERLIILPAPGRVMSADEQDQLQALPRG